jgi:hypothetical protein
LWSSHSLAYTEWDSGAAAWQFVAAVEGMVVWVADENLVYTFDGAAWVQVAGAPAAVPFVTISDTVSADQDDYAPTGWAGADMVRLTLDADWTVTGFLDLAAGAGPNVKYIVNASPGGEAGDNALRLAAEDAGSAAANRIANSDGDVYLHPGEEALLVRDGTTARWRVVSEPHTPLYGTVGYVLTAAGTGAGVKASYQAPAAIPALVGDSGAGGVAGLAPAPAAGDAALRKFLMADGSWDFVESGIQPAAIAAQADNYTPTDWASATLVQIQLTGDQTLTGLGQLSFGTVRRLHNVDATNTLSIAHNSGSSTNVNRISTFDGATALLAPGETATFFASSTVAMGGCWILVDISMRSTALADMAQGTIKGRAAGAGTGVPTDRTDAQVLLDMTTVTAGIAAAGGTQGAATALTSVINQISSATSLAGVKLLTAAPGLRQTVINSTAVTIRVWPNTFDNLGPGVDASVDLGAGMEQLYEAYNTTNWRPVSAAARSLRDFAGNDLAISQVIDGEILRRSGLTVISGADNAIMFYVWSTATVEPPTSVAIRVDNATPSSVTRVWIPETGSYTHTYTSIFDLVTPGSLLRLHSSALPYNYALYRVTSWVDDGTYRDFTVTHIFSYGTFTNSEKIGLSFDFNGALGQSVITPGVITSNENDYYPTGWDNADVVRLDLNADSYNITGFKPPTANGRYLKHLININTGYKILRLVTESASSTAAYRTMGPYGASAAYPTSQQPDYPLSPGASVVIWYDATSARWRILDQSRGATLLRRTEYDTGIAATHTFMPEADLYELTLVGGGGGGGGAAGGAAASAVGSGGGAGEILDNGTLIAIVAATATYTVGAGGAGGTAGDNDGAAGGATSFGPYTANGGAGGLGGADSATPTIELGGAGGSGGDGIAGDPGSPSIRVAATMAASGKGGRGLRGPGGDTKCNTNAVGNNAAIGSFGSGGGGGIQTASVTARAGGNATGGLIVVTEWGLRRGTAPA